MDVVRALDHSHPDGRSAPERDERVDQHRRRTALPEAGPWGSRTLTRRTRPLLAEGRPSGRLEPGGSLRTPALAGSAEHVRAAGLILERLFRPRCAERSSAADRLVWRARDHPERPRAVRSSRSADGTSSVRCRECRGSGQPGSWRRRPLPHGQERPCRPSRRPAPAQGSPDVPARVPAVFRPMARGTALPGQVPATSSDHGAQPERQPHRGPKP